MHVSLNGAVQQQLNVGGYVALLSASIKPIITPDRLCYRRHIHPVTSHHVTSLHNTYVPSSSYFLKLSFISPIFRALYNENLPAPQHCTALHYTPSMPTDKPTPQPQSTAGRKATGASGGAYVKFECKNARREDHPRDYRWVDSADSLCAHCQVVAHLLAVFGIGGIAGG